MSPVFFFCFGSERDTLISFWPWKASSKILEPSLIQEPEEPADAKAKPKAPSLAGVNGHLPGCLLNPEIMPLITTRLMEILLFFFLIDLGSFENKNHGIDMNS